MNKIGHDNDLNDESQPTSRSILFLGVLGISVVIALIIGFQVIGVLVAIVFPPRPPLIADAIQTSYTQKEYGVDEWTYSISQYACDVATYYRAQNAVCTLDTRCSNNERPTTNARVVECTGDITFSQFAMRWLAIVAVDADNPLESTLKITREIFWTGQLPVQTDN